MAKPRVHEVAKELGLTSKEVLAHLEKIGEAVKSHSSTIDEALADRVRSELSGNGAAAPAKAAPKAASKTAAKAEPKKTEPKNAEAKKTEPKKTEPEKSEPKKSEPTKSDAPPARPKAGGQIVERTTPKPRAGGQIVERATPRPKPAPAPPAQPQRKAPPAATKPAQPQPASAPAKPAAEASAPAPAAPAAPEGSSESEAPAETEPITVHRGVTVKDLAEKIEQSPADIVKVLLGLGEMVTVNQSLPDDAIGLVAEELGITLKVIDPAEEEAVEQALADAEEDEGKLVARPPVVTVMGHVDHGKTAILDAIRRTHVAAGEAGGITQHIGAYQVHVNDRDITFIDTPGHEAFTAMRARGAQVTDVAVLVVAADDGVMPQTVEAIDHAKAAKVPIVVAVNKVDKPEADPMRVRQQLSDQGLIPEEWGGDTVFVDVSAKARTNLEGLLEMILLTGDVQLDLKANPTARASGVVIEAHLDKGRGPVGTVLVKRGTLRDGDSLVAGAAWGRVRAMLDENGNAVSEATPGDPVLVLGWNSVPEAGDDFRSFEDEKDARRLANEREQHRRAAENVQTRAATLETLLEQSAEGEIPELNLLVKADAQGSVEAVADQLAKLDQELVRINIIRKGVGAITENDITLAQASNAIVIGFNVIENAQARTLAEEAGVDVRTYRVIYQAVQDIEAAAKGLLGPLIREVPLGQAEVRATFRVPRLGVVAGCMVIDGVIRRNSKLRLVRDGTVVYESNVGSLRRFKDDVREVAAGYECGIGIEGFQDIKEGDIIQAFEEQEVAR